MLRGAKYFVVAGTLSLVAAVPAHASDARVDGTVVNRAAARTFVVATGSGRMLRVQSSAVPAVGRGVRVSAKRVGFERYSARRLVVLSRRHAARLRGSVASVSKGSRLFRVVSQGGSAVVRTRSTADLPHSGRHVNLVVRIGRDGKLWLSRSRSGGKRRADGDRWDDADESTSGAARKDEASDSDSDADADSDDDSTDWPELANPGRRDDVDAPIPGEDDDDAEDFGDGDS